MAGQFRKDAQRLSVAERDALAGILRRTTIGSNPERVVKRIEESGQLGTLAGLIRAHIEDPTPVNERKVADFSRMIQAY